MSEEEFRERFRGSPLKRARRDGLARNAAIVLANRRRAES
jgi:epoxyqueuosine reductase QueG